MNENVASRITQKNRCAFLQFVPNIENDLNRANHITEEFPSFAKYSLGDVRVNKHDTLRQNC
jgi:hypothetical protein